MPKHTKASHAEYLASDHWQRTRKARIEAGYGACERCDLPRWLAEIAYGQDLHVHHLHYRTVGKEVDEDLEVLCARCHDIETFGRSKFRAPKEAICEICSGTHWDYRSAVCPFCEAAEQGYTSFNKCLVNFWRDAIHLMARQIHYQSMPEWAPVDELFRELARLREHAKKMPKSYDSIGDDEIPF